MFKKRIPKKKRDKDTSISSRQKVILLFALIIFSIILFFGKNGYLTIVRLRGEVESLKQEIKKLELKIKNLATEVNSLKTDPEVIEAQARRAGMIKKGEKIIKFVDEEGVVNDR